jgi:hypothetical protein
VKNHLPGHGPKAAIQPAGVHAPDESFDRLDGPRLRAMTSLVWEKYPRWARYPLPPLKAWIGGAFFQDFREGKRG